MGYCLADMKLSMKMAIPALQLFFFPPCYISLACRGYHEILCQMLAEDKMLFFFSAVGDYLIW